MYVLLLPPVDLGHENKCLRPEAAEFREPFVMQQKLTDTVVEKDDEDQTWAKL